MYTVMFFKISFKNFLLKDKFWIFLYKWGWIKSAKSMVIMLLKWHRGEKNILIKWWTGYENWFVQFLVNWFGKLIFRKSKFRFTKTGKVFEND